MGRQPRKIFLDKYKQERLEIVRLRDEEGWTWHQIAGKYNVTETAVIRRYQREKG